MSGHRATSPRLPSLARAATALAACAAMIVAFDASAGSQVTASRAALATASPVATQVGLSVLRNGGNAIDAAVAVSFALAVVRPDAGNLGGGGVLVYYEAKSGGVWTLDYREVAPGEAKRELTAAGSAPVLRAAVPGSVAGLEAMHAKFGSRPWKELLAPAIVLAKEGMRVEGDFATALTAADAARNLRAIPSTAALFFPKETAVAAGTRLVQPDLAATLARLARAGARDFYEGTIATQLVESTRTAGGIISLRDLRDYKAVWRAPLRIRFRDLDIYTVPPPSGGGLVLAEALNILSGYDLAASGFGTPASIHLLVEAERRAWLDRNRYVADPAVNRIPYKELLSTERAALWRKTIAPDRVTATASLADPQTAGEREHTTHFTIADAEGNVAAVTTTLTGDFGCGVVLPPLGFFLNAAMDDFSAAPGQPNATGLVEGIANRLASGKRPASSLTPVVVLKGDRPYLAAGSTGGAMIPTTLLQLLLNVVVWNKSLYEAVDAARFHHQGQPDEIVYESMRTPAATLERLNAIGHAAVVRPSIGEVQALMFKDGAIVAVADPRHGGAAGGY